MTTPAKKIEERLHSELSEVTLYKLVVDGVEFNATICRVHIDNPAYDPYSDSRYDNYKKLVRYSFNIDERHIGIFASVGDVLVALSSAVVLSDGTVAANISTGLRDDVQALIDARRGGV